MNKSARYKVKDYWKKQLGMIACLLFLTLDIMATPAILITDSELRAKPKFTADSRASLSKGESVTIKSRQRGWYQVERSNQQSGWVTLLQVRFSKVKSNQAGSELSKIVSLRQGHNNITATTGVRGIGENEIKNSTANFIALATASKYRVGEKQAQEYASKIPLKEQSIPYLEKNNED